MTDACLVLVATQKIDRWPITRKIKIIWERNFAVSSDGPTGSWSQIFSSIGLAVSESIDSFKTHRQTHSLTHTQTKQTGVLTCPGPNLVVNHSVGMSG